MAVNERSHIGDAGIGIDGLGHALRLLAKGAGRAIGCGALAATLLCSVPFVVMTNVDQRELAFHATYAQAMHAVSSNARIRYDGKPIRADAFLAAIERRPEMQAKVTHVKAVGWTLAIFPGLPVLIAVSLLVYWISAFVGTAIRSDVHLQGAPEVMQDVNQFNHLARLRRWGRERKLTRFGQLLLKMLA